MKTPNTRSFNMTQENQAADTPAVEEKKIKFCDKSSEGTVASFSFGDGTDISLDTNELSDDVKEALMMHGLLQKGGDSYAGAAGDYKFAKERLQAVLQNLLEGKFNATRAAGEKKPKTGELAEALAALKSVEVAEASAAIEAMTEEQLKEVRAHPRVKAKIAELRAIKAAKAAEGKEFDL
jgi:hypothetical protein